MARKILVAIGSPRRDGNTTQLANEFKRGAEEAGHEVIIENVACKKITPCQACEFCLKSGGMCCLDDDMQDLYDELHECDTLVFASPIYYYTFTAQIKAFMDRMFCAIGGNPFSIKDCALLTCFEDKDPSVADSILLTYRSATAYCHWNNLGEVVQNDTYERGAINKHPEALQKAYELGKSLQ